MSITPYLWPRFLRILNLKHFSNDVLVDECYDLSNMLHVGGQNFILSCCFNTAVHTVPSIYYIGLDNRSIIQESDVITNLIGEPSGYGYVRQPVSSSTGWTIANFPLGVVATSPVISFLASGGSYGPVLNLFLTTALDNTGVLIATAPFSGHRTLNDGDHLTMQLAVSLINDPTSGSALS